eukprot:4469267-Amphidinium_carterae.3
MLQASVVAALPHRRSSEMLVTSGQVCSSTDVSLDAMDVMCELGQMDTAGASMALLHLDS